MLPAQQAWPGPPHCAHMPALHAPPLAQLVPVATQLPVPGSQHPPPLQVLLAQQGWPGPPHCSQVSLPLQAVPAAVHACPAQQS
jgi:hypothetical protein